jgi:hypothetical protein
MKKHFLLIALVSLLAPGASSTVFSTIGCDSKQNYLSAKNFTGGGYHSHGSEAP